MNRAAKYGHLLLGGGGLLCAALLVVFLLAYRSDRQTEEVQGWVLHTRDVLAELAAVRLHNARAYGRCSTFVETGERPYLDECRESAEEIGKSLYRVRALTPDNPAQQLLLDKLIPAEQAYATTLRVSAEAAAEQRNPRTAAQRFDPPPQTVLALVQAMERNEQELLRQRTTSARKQARNSRLFLLATSVFSLLVILISGRITYRELARRARIEAGLHRAQEMLGVRLDRQKMELDHALEDLFSQIRRREQAEQAVRKLNEQLEERVRLRTAEVQEVNRELEAFVYSASHDLRAPLRHLDGFSRMLEQGLEASASEESRHYLRRIREAVVRMTTLVESLLRLSKIGKQTPQSRWVSLAALAQHAQEEALGEAGSRAIRWQIEALPGVYGDSELLRHVFINLVSNAVKFTRGKPAAEIRIGSFARQGEIVVFVKDNGAGFDPSYADKLFGVFQRLHRQDEFEGTGIGLAIAQRIIHRHGGRVWAESQPGQGATFFFALPAAAPVPLSEDKPATGVKV